MIPIGDPAESETADLVTTIRDYVVPQTTDGEDIEAYVGGPTASYVDLAAGISDTLVLVIFAVSGSASWC